MTTDVQNGCGGNGNGCGLNSCLWIILLLICCGWDAAMDLDATMVMATAMTVVCGSSFFFAAAADGAIMDWSDAAVAVMAATVADADICSFFLLLLQMGHAEKPHHPFSFYLFKRFGFPVTTTLFPLFSSDVIFFSFHQFSSFFFNIHFSSISYTALPSMISFLDIFVFFFPLLIIIDMPHDYRKRSLIHIRMIRFFHG